MSRKGKQNTRRRSGHTKGRERLNVYQRNRTKLVPPLQAAGISPVLTEYERDVIPEYLWIASLYEMYEKSYMRKFQKFMNHLDDISTQDKFGLLGLITDFENIKIDLNKIDKDILIECFILPFGGILQLYPEAPCYYLLDPEILDEIGGFDYEHELGRLRKILFFMYPAKDIIAGEIRMMPFERLLVHKKLRFQHDLPTLELLQKYPSGLNEEEKLHVQQFVRTALGAVFGATPTYKDKKWPKYFWRHNINLSTCKLNINSSAKKEGVEFNDLINRISKVHEEQIEAINYNMNKILNSYKYDLYDPRRDEVLLGLIGRIIKLYISYVDDIDLWEYDINMIILRCFIDTGITFMYMKDKATDEEIESFISYSEGRQRLLSLFMEEYHVEENLEGRQAADISLLLGGDWRAANLEIELKNWTKKSARQLSKETGMETFYKMIYDPASEHVHGSWNSIRDTVLVRCVEPLHRYHRIPVWQKLPILLAHVTTMEELMIKFLEAMYIDKHEDYKSINRIEDRIKDMEPINDEKEEKEDE